MPRQGRTRNSGLIERYVRTPLTSWVISRTTLEKGRFLIKLSVLDCTDNDEI